MRVHKAVVVHHGGHEAGGEGVPREEGEGGGGVAGGWGVLAIRLQLRSSEVGLMGGVRGRGTHVSSLLQSG